MVIRKLNGVFPSIITPFKENQEVDYGKFARNLEKWNEDPLSGYLVLGSSGEAAYLEEKEKIKLIELTMEVADRNKLILASTGMESTKASIKLTNKAAGSGIDAALLLTPFYFKNQMDDQVLINYFTEVADHADIPIILYNEPKFTRVDISSAVVGVLSKHPNIIGIKDSSADIAKLADMKRHVADGFNILAGSAYLWYPALHFGIEGGIMALANCVPNECVGIQEAFNQGNYKEAEQIYLRLFPVNQAITTRYGVAGLKFAVDILGYESGNVRKPLLPLNEEAQEEIRKTMAYAQLFRE
ncbi:MAG: dihydrodipicolinate synthase family protein [Candidatus Cyclobacteriaceae bacterium M3_2C_046]